MLVCNNFGEHASDGTASNAERDHGNEGCVAHEVNRICCYSWGCIEMVAYCMSCVINTQVLAHNTPKACSATSHMMVVAFAEQLYHVGCLPGVFEQQEHSHASYIISRIRCSNVEELLNSTVPCV